MSAIAGCDENHPISGFSITTLYFVEQNCFIISETSESYHSGKSSCYLCHLSKQPIFKVVPLTNSRICQSIRLGPHEVHVSAIPQYRESGIAGVISIYYAGDLTASLNKTRLELTVITVNGHHIRSNLPYTV